jgi:putative glutamine amidotransferase
MKSRPRVVVTVAVPARQREPDVTQRKNDLYAESVRRHGGEPVVVDAATDPKARRAAFATMDGLLLTGGADVDPARYGRPNDGSVEIEPDRDELEVAAWQAAEDRGLPILGICRGLQALNVFYGGTLLQDVKGHMGPSWSHGEAMRHPVRVAAGTRLARILFPTNSRGGVVEVNSYHHQAVRPADLAPTLVPNAFATSKAGEIVEGLETRSGRFVMGLQCHPERTESTPAAFERVFSVFVDACRGTVVDRGG